MKKFLFRFRLKQHMKWKRKGPKVILTWLAEVREKLKAEESEHVKACISPPPTHTRTTLLPDILLVIARVSAG